MYKAFLLFAYTQHSVVVNKCTYLLCIITLTEMHKTCVLKTIAVLLVRRQKKSIEENASSTDLSQRQVRLKNISVIIFPNYLCHHPKN